MNIPNDADGDVMRRVLAHGADATRPMAIDFQIDCPDHDSAELIAAEIPQEEFRVKIYKHDADDDMVTCVCTKSMLLEHSELLRIQAILTEIARPHGGHCDAWGTFGN